MTDMTLLTKSEAIALINKAQSFGEVSAKHTNEVSKMKGVRVIVLK